MPAVFPPSADDTQSVPDAWNQEAPLLLVDDNIELLTSLRDLLVRNGYQVLSAVSVDAMEQALQDQQVALLLLDIGLPDGDGVTLLPELRSRFADMAIVMLTAEARLQTALTCLRQGADDYLTKPVQFDLFLEVVSRVLEKRRLRLANRQYHQELERAYFRLQLQHALTMKMNRVALGTTELEEILRVILVGVTSKGGLAFQRAFLAIFDEQGHVLAGRMGIGAQHEGPAGQLWQRMRGAGQQMTGLIEHIKSHGFTVDPEINRIVHALQVENSNDHHLLIRAVQERCSVKVVGGRARWPVPPELIGLLQEDTFLVVPLFSPGRSLGVIIADQHGSAEPITPAMIGALESLASQASLAIEHCRLYQAMERKIGELEAMGRQLEKNKDLLVESERYSAVGSMASQLAHKIRNPITSIGGTARLLARKTDDPEQRKFLDMMTREVEKIEATLEDMFNFVNQFKPIPEKISLYLLIHKALMLFYKTMRQQGVEYVLDLPEPAPEVNVDPHLMQQVMLHLIRNSIEAMADGGELVITVASQTDQVTIQFQDSGIGMTSQQQEQATEPFFTTKTFGTGMGLTLVKRIVNDHQGSLAIDSAPGKGTTITLTLPLT